ncbi:MAG: phosphatase PAP2 family protein [Planctomycetaceae bacterium]|nr:phosphatase PAP2 family protein [Planctomycetaceae bacterium]
MTVPRQGYPWLGHFLCIAPTVVMVVVFWIVFASETSLEHHFLTFRLPRPSLTRAVSFLTDHGALLFYAVYAVILLAGLKQARTRRFILCFILAFSLTMVTVWLFKGVVGRARPFLDPGFDHWSWGEDYDSFPSGHTTEALSCALPLAWWFGRRWLALLAGLYAALIALTRIYLGVHFMTDILGGVAMASFAGYFSWWLYMYIPLPRHPGNGSNTYPYK